MTDNRFKVYHCPTQGGESRVRCTFYPDGMMVTLSLETEMLCLYMDHVLSAAQARELAGWILENTEGSE